MTPKRVILFFLSVTNNIFEKLRGAHPMIFGFGSGKKLLRLKKKLYKKIIIKKNPW